MVYVWHMCDVYVTCCIRDMIITYVWHIYDICVTCLWCISDISSCPNIFTTEPYTSTQEPYMYMWHIYDIYVTYQWCVCDKSPQRQQSCPNISAKEPYISAKQLYISAKEQYIYPQKRATWHTPTSTILPCFLSRASARSAWCLKHPTTSSMSHAASYFLKFCCRVVCDQIEPRWGRYCSVWHTLRHTATRCNALYHAATDCNGLRHCNTLQHTATHCNTRAMLSLGEVGVLAVRDTPLVLTPRRMPLLKNIGLFYRPHFTHVGLLSRSLFIHVSAYSSAWHCGTVQDIASHCNTLQH